MNTGRRKVAIVYKSLPQYRRRFFELLRERLEDLSIDLVLIYGQPGPKDKLKKDTVDLPWAHRVENKIWKLRGRELYWQPVLGLLKGTDLVVVEQASKLLVNYVLLLLNALGIRRLAFWGHGRNFQPHTASGWGEWVKRMVSTRVHWWFAYNELSAQAVRTLGFPAERITLVQNAIDTRHLTESLQGLSPEAVELVRTELGLKGNNVAVYAGGMYEEKRLPFLLESCRRVRAQVPDFEVIFIGGGADSGLIRAATQRYEWVHYVGPKFDEDKVPYFAASKLFLMPGLLGLAILDAFALEVPVVTTDVPFHSPEVEYLSPGVNGVMVSPYKDASAYAAAVTSLLQDEGARQRLVEGCRQARARYNVEQMADRFAQGVMQALESDDARA